MAPLYLPRVGAFPILAENHPVTVMGTSTQLPLTVKKDFPLKDKIAPDFVLTDHKGRPCSLHATIQLGRPIILFFFPLAGSPHCTSESCLFRDAIALTPIFSDLQAIVIGISQDIPLRAQKFVEEHRLTYRILCDEKRKVMDAYGVSRTTFGLVDNRSTFIIDPSGLVRGLAEGVLNSRGHLKFAEQWLIRLEHELSERSRQCLEVTATADDMIADIHTDRLMQVIYGQERSAQHGGIGGTPRYGAGIPKLPYSHPRPHLHHQRRASLEDKTIEDVTEPKTEISAKHSTPEKNMWKNWKSLLSQLSSPDDKPPPLVMQTRSRSASTATAPGDLPSSPTSMTRSRSNVKSPSPKAADTPRRSKSRFGSRRQSRTESDREPISEPSLPKSSLSESATNQIRRKVEDRKRTSRVESSTDDEASVGIRSTWGTDNSLEGSGKSTAPSSYADHSRGSHSLIHQSLMNSPKRASGIVEARLTTPPPTRPRVTSEILMADAIPDKETAQRRSAIILPEDFSRPFAASPSLCARIDRNRAVSYTEGRSHASMDALDGDRRGKDNVSRAFASGLPFGDHEGVRRLSQSPSSLARIKKVQALLENLSQSSNASWSPKSLQDPVRENTALPSNHANRAIQRVSIGGASLSSSPSLSRSMDKDSPFRSSLTSRESGLDELDISRHSPQRALSTQLASPRVSTSAARAPERSFSNDAATSKWSSLGSNRSNSLVLQSLSTSPLNASQHFWRSEGNSAHGHDSRRDSNSYEAAQDDTDRSIKLSGWTEMPWTQLVSSPTPSPHLDQKSIAVGIPSGLPAVSESSSPLSATSTGVGDDVDDDDDIQYLAAYDPLARRSSQADSIASTGTFG